MRGVILGAALAALSLSTGASTARAQGNFSDPFYLYYGWYLPRQQVLANQPGPEVGIMANQVARQQAITSDRASLYAPIRGIGEDELNSTSPYSGRTGRSGVPRFSPNGISSTNKTGMGHPNYYTRVNNYYPSMRTGTPRAGVRRAPPNLSSARPGGGGMSMPSATQGMGGGGPG